MSNPVEPIPTQMGEFASPLGGSFGSPVLEADSKIWEHRCGELLKEREKLRAELTLTQKERDQYLKSLHYFLRKEDTRFTFTREEVFAHLDDKPTIQEVIAELESSVEKPA